MNVTRYLVDNNALGTLGYERRRSSFFREHCRLPEDVLYEARARRDYAALRELVYPVTAAVLAHLQTVMSTISPSDTSLVDLYKNLGAADPLIIASALDASDKEDGLFPDTWIIVSHDRAVLSQAAEHAISTISPESLADLVDAGSEAPRGPAD